MQDPNLSSAPPLRVRLLGRVEIAVGDREIPDQLWPGRLPRTLLLLLLATPGHRLPRDRVLDILWPEAEPDSALNALYKTLHTVRRILEPGLKTGRDSAYVTILAESLGLTPAPGMWVDANAFDAALARSETVNPPERRQLLRAALDLYRGDLLSDELYADWPVVRRESLRQSRERAALALAGLDQDAGEPLAIVPVLQALLADDATIEEAHRALMRAYATAGQRELALRQFERCRAVLESDLGAEPAAETIALREIIAASPGEAPAPIMPSLSGTRPQPFWNLPAAPNALVGRDTEVDEIQALLLRRDVRLVTLTGPGGIGKTRLALEIAAGLGEDFPDGIAFVALASLQDPDLVLSTIARTLDLRDDAGGSAEASLHAALAGRVMLLVLDNFEHLVPAAPAVSSLVSACDRLTVLVTSREALRLRSEHERILRPLIVPNLDHLPAPHTLPRYGAVALFQQAILARRPDFAITAANAKVIAEICVRLDGLPLALELAAARCRHLEPRTLLVRLTRPLDVLTDGPRDAPSRQRTLRDAIAWSYDLLSANEQTLFRRLAVFTGGCTLDGAEVVSRGAAESVPDSAAPRLLNLVDSLADKSLVVVDADEGQPRVRMLETIREFAMERLAATDEAESIARAHAEFFATLAEEASRDHRGPRQAAALAGLDPELDNLRAALGWAISRQERELALRMAGGLWRFWSVRGLVSEGRAWLDQALALSRTDADPSAADALIGSTLLAVAQGDFDAAARHGEDALSAARSSGNPRLTATALGEISTAARVQGRFADAVRLDDEALALCRACGDDWGVAATLNRQGILAYLQNDHVRAAPLLEDALAGFRRLGDRRAAGLTLMNLGVLAFYGGDFDRALVAYEEGLVIARELDDRARIMIALTNLGEVLRFIGDTDRGAGYAVEAVAMARTIGDRQAIAIALHVLGTLRQAQGDMAEAQTLLAEELALFLPLGDRLGTAWCLEALAGLAVVTDQPEMAARFLGAAAGLRAEIQSQPQPAETPILERTMASARAILGDTGFQLALAAGQSAIDETVTAAGAFAAAPLPPETFPAASRE